MYALMGMKLWAEYLDGIAVATITPAESKSAETQSAKTAKAVQ